MRGPETDLHSGNFGGAVHNPLQVLCEIVARLQDARGRIAIPGFYDRVRRASGPRAPRDGCRRAIGPRHRSPRQARRGVGATGVHRLRADDHPAGADGHGGSRVATRGEAPRRSCRRAHRQCSISVLPRIRIPRRSIGCAGGSSPGSLRRRCASRCARGSARRRSRPPRDSRAVRAAVAAYRAGFGRAPAFLKIGGTIPVVHLLERVLRVPTVMMGFALPDSNLHAPDENLHLPTFFRGIRTSLAVSARARAERCVMIIDCHCHAGRGRRADRPMGHGGADWPPPASAPRARGSIGR